eukprot:Skav207285  [mRNA]  locus=scaffold434:184385:186523:- [translate_table: standard]
MKTFLAALLPMLPCIVAGRYEVASPVSRVVNMLKELDKKLENEADTEKDLFQKYQCWAESTVNEKTASVEKATQRMSSLQTYVSDVEAGKITFTADKENLEKELAGIRSELANITTERAKEHKSFEMNKGDMEKAIAGLKEVITNLEATSLNPKKAAVLMSLRGGDAVTRRAHAKNLKEGLAVSDKYLSRSKRQFLHRFLGSTLSTDRSQTQGIVDQLEKVESSIEGDLKEDAEQEEDAEKTFKKEHAARAQAIENSKEEVASLKEQVEADQKLIPEVKKALEDKKSQFDERSSYRLGELKAIGEAISLLMDDENRDLFASSFSFLQLSQSQSAGKALSSAYSASRDGRVSALIALLHQQDSSGAFEQVITKINEMIGLLKKEDADDLEKKDTCVANKAKDEASQVKFERSVEDLQTTVSFNDAKLKELMGQIDTKKTEIADVESQLKKAADVRAAEKAEFTKATEEDKAAVALLKEAANKISSFYKKTAAKQLSLTQVTAKEPAGAPKTWEGSYSGAGTQSTGVVHMMEVLIGDLEKESEVATKEEAEAEEVFQDSKKDLESQKAGLESAIDQLEKGKGEVDSDKQDAREEMKLKKDSLTALLQKMKDIQPECNYYIVNFEKRSKNRMTEINGLAQAKAILEGSS